MSDNSNLHNAKTKRNDEYFTFYYDIAKECEHYRHHFKGKVIYCNCDDFKRSQFVKYFKDNFEQLGLAKLIATCLREDGTGTLYVFDGVREASSQIKDGDFYSEQCREMLCRSDIVVTNPPFSKFRNFIAMLMNYNKKFLIIGSSNAITYKEVFPLIRDEKLWLGYNHVKEFMMPDGSTKKFGNIQWFTNMDIDKKHEFLTLTKEYNEKDYPKYDNYDAINVDKIKDIPKDYDGVMGVPITFIDKFNPEQFEIVAFRKGYDGKDLVYTREEERRFNNEVCPPVATTEREREANYSTVLPSACATAKLGLITGAKHTLCQDGKSRFCRVAIRKR